MFLVEDFVPKRTIVLRALVQYTDDDEVILHLPPTYIDYMLPGRNTKAICGKRYLEAEAYHAELRYYSPWHPERTEFGSETNYCHRCLELTAEREDEHRTPVPSNDQPNGPFSEPSIGNPGKSTRVQSMRFPSVDSVGVQGYVFNVTRMSGDEWGKLSFTQQRQAAISTRVLRQRALRTPIWTITYRGPELSPIFRLAPDHPG